MNRKLKEVDIKMLKRISKQKLDKFQAVYSYHAMRSVALALFKFILSEDDESMKEEAAKNYLITVVTGFEMFLKDTIIENRGRWKRDGLRTLLDEKITIHDAYEMFEDAPISREAFVMHFYSFQGMPSINKVFKLLLGSKDFYDDIQKQKYAYTGDDQITLKDIGDWKRDLANIYKLRNELVHDNRLSITVKPVEIMRLGLVLTHIAQAMVMPK